MTEANITWLTDQVATGGDFSFNHEKAYRQLDELLEMDIDLVIDCRLEAEDTDIWSDVGVNYLHLPTDDRYGHHIPRDHFDRAVQEAMYVIEDGGKVFIHCHMGVNRGPSTAYAVLLAMGYGPTEAFDLIRAKRPQAGIVYAEDALDAHNWRTGVSPAQSEDLAKALIRHINKVMTAKERRSIQRIIRDNHARDALERNMITN